MPKSKGLSKLKTPKLTKVESVGIELEGGLCTVCILPLLRKYADALHITCVTDGSVNVSSYEATTKCKHYSKDVFDDSDLGEFDDANNENWGVNREIKAWVNVRSLPKLFSFVKELFESTFFVQNDTCGNHIHIRLRDKTQYERKFGTKQAWDSFTKAYVGAFDDIKYHDRLHDRFCSSDFEPEKIYSDEHDDRYKMINFVSLTESQKTLEFRILPFFENSTEAMEAYSKMLTIIERQAAESEVRRRD